MTTGLVGLRPFGQFSLQTLHSFTANCPNCCPCGPFGGHRVRNTKGLLFGLLGSVWTHLTAKRPAKLAPWYVLHEKAGRERRRDHKLLGGRLSRFLCGLCQGTARKRNTGAQGYQTLAHICSLTSPRESRWERPGFATPCSHTGRRIGVPGG